MRPDQDGAVLVAAQLAEHRRDELPGIRHGLGADVALDWLRAGEQQLAGEIVPGDRGELTGQQLGDGAAPAARGSPGPVA